MLAFFLSQAAQQFEPFPPTPFDRVIPIVIDEKDPVLAGHGHAERVTYKAEFSGTLHLWTKAAGELDLCLRVETPGGELVKEDDNSGGGKTPYVKLEVELGRELVIVTAVAQAEGLGSLELCAIAAPETDETRAVVKVAKLAYAEVKRLRESGNLADGRKRAREALDACLALPAGRSSELVALSTWALGHELHDLSDIRSTALAWRHDLSHSLRTRPEEHHDLLLARGNLAVTIRELGDLTGARALQERVLAVCTRTLPEEHPDLQSARVKLAATNMELGDLEGARALKERVLEVRARTLPEDHPDLQRARQSLAVTLVELGDLAGARALEERVLEVRSQTLPEEHPDLQAARENLAATIMLLGDLQGARVLQESVLEVRSRTLPEDHYLLQTARGNLAATSLRLGDRVGARALQERVLEVFSRTLPEEDPDLQVARQNLAATLKGNGDLQGARALEERVLEVRSRTLPDEHPRLQAARQNLAVTLYSLGDLAGAKALQERVLDVDSRTLPEDHPDLQSVRLSLAVTTLAQSSFYLREVGGEMSDRENKSEMARETEGAAQLLRDRSQAQTRVAREVRLNAPGREAEVRCESLTEYLDFTLAVVLGYGGLESCAGLCPAAFTYSEATRNAAVSSSALARRATKSEAYAPARDRLRSATEKLARLMQGGTNSEEYRTTLAAREAAESALLALGRAAAGGRATGLELDAASLSAVLKPGDVAVAYRSYARVELSWPDASAANGFCVPHETTVDSLCAFVVRPRDLADTKHTANGLTLLDLGPLEAITAAITNWRDALGASDGRGVRVTSRAATPALAAHGTEVRRLVFDPLRAALGDAQHVVVVLDGPLQLVPLDALPAGDDDTKLLGDTLRIETRTTLGELLDAPLPLEGERVFVGLGGAEFDGEHAEAKKDGDSAAEASAVIAAAMPAKSASLPSILRGGAFGTGFSALPGTLRELEGLEREFTNSAGAGATLTLLRGKDATKQALLAAAPRARWLHIATHGWFAPESIRSWEDRDPVDAKSGLALRMSGEETVKGMSPMLLCGLALAGANLPEDAVGRAPGLLTADELSTLDLSNCELAVLSACDTARGEMRRAGQGVASLQKALQIAGARSVITSLWKVPDEATKDLMLDFYRRLWVDKKPKWQALWEAKTKLRNAKDERGAPKYTTRDWAAWVLTGEPD